MLIYFAFFSVSILLLTFVSRFREPLLKGFFLVLSLVLIAFLSGWRDFSIGDDTGVYINYWHIICGDWSLREFWLFFSGGSLEELYLLYSFILSYITHDDQLFLFFTQLLILISIVLAAYKCRVSVVWAVFIYLMLLFTFSLNVVRQIISIGFVLIALANLLQEKYFRVLSWIMVAYGFHHSAILYIGVLILYLFIRKFYRFMQLRIVKISVLIAISLLFTILFSSIGVFLISNFMGSEYENFTASDSFGVKFPIALFGLSVFNAVIYYCMKFGKRDRLLCFFDYLIYLSPVICLSGLISRYLVRIVYYPLFSVILIFPILFKSYNILPIWKFVIIISYLAYFYLTAIPYKFIA